MRAANRLCRGQFLTRSAEGIRRFRSECEGRLALQIMFVDVDKGLAEMMAEVAYGLCLNEVQTNTHLGPCNFRPLTSEVVATIRAKFDGMKQVAAD